MERMENPKSVARENQKSKIIYYNVGAVNNRPYIRSSIERTPRIRQYP